MYLKFQDVASALLLLKRAKRFNAPTFLDNTLELRLFFNKRGKTSMKLNQSQFSVLRIVALVLAADGEVVPKEQRWFSWFLGRFELTPEQVELLKRDSNSSPQLSELCALIDSRDYERLKSWLQIAMKIDGHQSKEEMDLVNQVLSLEAKPSPDPNQVLAQTLVEHSDSVEFWKSMGTLGKRLTKRIPWWRRLWLSP